MRKFALFLFLILSAASTSAQVYDPVKWDFGYVKTGDKQYELIFTASVEKKWHIYSIDIPDGGPIPTSFSFDTMPAFKLSGKIYEVTKPVEVLDEAFGFKIKTFSTKAEFRQKIDAVESSFTVKGAVNFMACNNVTCSPPKDAEFEIKIKNQLASQTITSSNSGETGSAVPVSDRRLLRFFLISLLAGFAGVLTPCVFPMIPMTVAFFSQGSENRRRSVSKALIFGLSIILIYSSLGIIVSLSSAGAGFANTLSTH
jgi:thiol:disulfide interchange protein